MTPAAIIQKLWNYCNDLRTNLDIFWLRDESLDNSDNLPEPGVIAHDMINCPGTTIYRQIYASSGAGGKGYQRSFLRAMG
jgi:hypothetical protein